LILVAASLMAIPAARSQDVAMPAGAQEAGCLLRIVTESSVISLSDNAIDYLFRSALVRGNAITKVLGSGIESRQAVIQAKILEVTDIEGPPSERSILLSLNVGLAEGVKPAAKELLEVIVANFQEAVASAYASEFERLDRQAFVAKQEMEHADRELTEVRNQLLAMFDYDSPETLRGRITEIRSQLQSLQLEKASQDAYRQAIVKRIEDIRDEIEKTVRNDTISSELEQIVQRRSVELQNVRQKVDAGLIPNADVAAMEDRLAAARIDLARRREELGKTGSAAGLAGLTTELATLTVGWEKIRATESQLDLQLKQTRDQLARSGDYERAMLRLEIAKRNSQEAQIAYSKLQQRLRTLQSPSITVIGG
jgi:hypothetical protein